MIQGLAQVAKPPGIPPYGNLQFKVVLHLCCIKVGVPMKARPNGIIARLF